MAIEAESFEFPWSEDDFLRCLRQRNCIGMVAELDDHVVGFMIYELHKNRLHVLNFAVAGRFRRRGIGTPDDRQARRQALAAAPQPDLAGSSRDESCRPSCSSAAGFTAVSVLREFYDDTPEDAYVMQYRCQEEAPDVIPFNRIAKLAG